MEKDKKLARRETLEFLLCANGDKDGTAKELADTLSEEYCRIADAFGDYRVGRLNKPTQGLVEVIQEMTSGRLERKKPDRRKVMKSPGDAGKFFMEWFCRSEREEFAALYLDGRKRSLECVTESKGGDYTVSLDIRKILHHADALGAKYVIIAHNHPNTPLLPSKADLTGTTMVTWGASMTGVELLDHIVVYDKDFISLYESGLLSDDRRLANAKLSFTGEKHKVLYRKTKGSDPRSQQ